MLWLQLFFPFAAGFFLSYVYRTANSIIAPLIGQELGLGDGDLGLLTSAYFLAFGLAQVPVGVLLDRYGPRRVEAGLLVVAAAGAAIYGSAHTLEGLTAGRAIIGLGVSVCLMGPLKAFAMFYPRERLASMTGWIMAAGGVGAIVATGPLDWVLGMVSWRTVCLIGAVVTLLAAVLIWALVPERPRQDGVMAGGSLMDQVRDLRQVFRSPELWRIAPMTIFFTGGFQALQGLWAARWMAVQSGAPKSVIVGQLTAMNVAALAGMLLLGSFATRLVRRGLNLEHIYRAGMGLALVAMLSMILWPGASGWLLWPLLGLCCSLNSLAFTLLAQTFPPSFAGRANTALNLVLLGGAFGLQWGLGLRVDGFVHQGLSLQDAYRATFTLLAVGQLAALLWLVGRPVSRTPFGVVPASGKA